MRIFTLAAAALMAFSSVAQADLIIDDFSSGSQTLSAAGGATTTESVAGTMIGGERDSLITNFGSEGRVDLDINNSFSGAGMTLYSESNNTDGKFELVYDGIDNSSVIDTASGLGGIDLTQAGANTGILFTGVASDLGTTLTFTVWSSTTDSSSYTIPVSSGNITSDVFVGFNQFSGTADFTTVTALRLTGDVALTQNGTDINLTSIVATTPEPASLAIMGLGGLLAGCGVARRRRKQASELAA
ncbi:MAG: PEP-CTERM sorting domain-containing protein [Planctomycetaceae bacterium]|nr:PEP-CTERM sorting domain-containing protein [Planctomycetaceae bacterium]